MYAARRMFRIKGSIITAFLLGYSALPATPYSQVRPLRAVPSLSLC